MIMVVTSRQLLRLITRFRVGAVNDGFTRVRGGRRPTGHPRLLARSHNRLDPHVLRGVRLLLVRLVGGVMAALQTTV